MTTFSSVAAIDSKLGTKVKLYEGGSKPTICLSCKMRLSTVMYIQILLDLLIILTSGSIHLCSHSCCHTCFYKIKKLDYRCGRCSQRMNSFTEFGACMGMPKQGAQNGGLLQSVKTLKLVASGKQR